MRWRPISPDALLARELDGELVVRNEATGSTHLLDAVAAEVLRTLLATPEGLSVAELAERLCSRDEELNHWSRAIESTLLEFQRLGLVEPAG